MLSQNMCVLRVVSVKSRVCLKGYKKEELHLLTFKPVEVYLNTNCITETQFSFVFLLNKTESSLFTQVTY